MSRLKSIRWLLLFAAIAMVAVSLTVNQSNNSFSTNSFFNPDGNRSNCRERF